MTKPTRPRVGQGGVLRVAAYGRVSTVNQLLENDSSIDTQLARIRRKAEFESEQAAHRPDAAVWKVVEAFREEGRSGKNIDRPALQRLLAGVREGRFDLVVVTKVDRITRSAVDFYGLWDVFKAHQVEFVALDDNFETTSATGRAMLGITLIFAQLERERTSERTREKVQARREGGLWFGGAIPVGYKPHPNDKTSLAVDDHWARIVREEMFEQYLVLGSARALVRHLARRGIVRPRRKTKSGHERGGGPFTVQGILDLLSCRLYLSERELDDGAVVKCKWPAIIGESLFERVQAKLARSAVDRPSGKTANGHVYLLDGLLRCGACGATMTRGAGTGRGRTYFYYRCGAKHRTAATGCKVRDIPVEAVETFVIGQLKRHAVDPAAITEAVRLANAGRDREVVAVEIDLAKARAALATASRAATALVDAVEQDAVEAGGSSGQVLRARLREREAAAQVLRLEVGDLELRRDALRQKLLDAEVVAEGYRSLPRVLDAALAQGAHEELRALLQAVIDVVEWREDSANPSQGTATIQFFELPEGFWADYGAQKEEQPREPMPLSSGSLGCPVWLPSVDLNHGPDD